MTAKEFIESKYEEGQITKWKPEMVDAIASFMEAYAEQEKEKLEKFKRWVDTNYPDIYSQFDGETTN
jgi:hypothetical protein